MTINPFTTDRTPACGSGEVSKVPEDDTGVSRRQFLSLAAGTVSIASLGISAAAFASQLQRIEKQLVLNVLQEPWLTIDEVQQILLPPGADPKTDGPGSRQIRALAYLQTATTLPQFDPDTTQFLHNGVEWLNELCQSRTGQDFVSLETATQQQMLEQIAKSRAGENWLSTLLTYILEAMLSAPAYGVNPDGVGWHWLKHQPGHPLPTEQTLWYQLL